LDRWAKKAERKGNLKTFSYWRYYPKPERWGLNPDEKPGIKKQDRRTAMVRKKLKEGDKTRTAVYEPNPAHALRRNKGRCIG